MQNTAGLAVFKGLNVHYSPTLDNFQFNNMNIKEVISKFNESLKPILPPRNHDSLTD